MTPSVGVKQNKYYDSAKHAKFRMQYLVPSRPQGSRYQELGTSGSTLFSGAHSARGGGVKEHKAVMHVKNATATRYRGPNAKKFQHTSPTAASSQSFQ